MDMVRNDPQLVLTGFHLDQNPSVCVLDTSVVMSDSLSCCCFKPADPIRCDPGGRFCVEIPADQQVLKRSDPFGANNPSGSKPLKLLSSLFWSSVWTSASCFRHIQTSICVDLLFVLTNNKTKINATICSVAAVGFKTPVGFLSSLFTWRLRLRLVQKYWQIWALNADSEIIDVLQFITLLYFVTL